MVLLSHTPVFRQVYLMILLQLGAIGITGEIRVKELPEMGYHLDGPNGPSGELMSGPLDFESYFKNPKETAKSVSKDGWLALEMWPDLKS